MLDRVEQPLTFWISWFIRILVAGIFLFSAYARWLQPAGFELFLLDTDLFEQRRTAGILARVLIGLEFALGLALLQPYYLKYVVAPLIAVFLVLFSGYLGYARFVLDMTENCGCFGELISVSPLGAMIKNVGALFMVAGVWSELSVNPHRPYVPGALLLCALLFSFGTLPMTPAADHSFEQFTQFEGAGRVDLSSGEKLVVVAEIDCPPCRETIFKIGEMKRAGMDLPGIYVLMHGTEDKKKLEEFWKTSRTRFPHHIISRADVLRLQRNQLPTIYLLRKGDVVKVWDENPARKIWHTFYEE